MNLGQKIGLIKSIVTAKVFKKPTPTIVSLIVTEKCNLSCLYCKTEENHRLSTEEIFEIINRLSLSGTKVLILTGGEPMIRPDIEEIVKFAKEKGLIVKVNTNGAFVRKKESILQYLDGVTISLDGPEAVHDKNRGEGGHKQALSGMECVKEHKVKLNLASVLSNANLDKECIDYLLDVGKNYSAFVTFQPASQELLRGQGLNTVTPNIEQYRKMIDYIIEKKKNKQCVGNSLSGLSYLREWPQLRSIQCAGHSLYRRINNTGNVQICGIVQESFGNIFDDDYKQVFQKSNERICNKCWCESRIELNLAASGDLAAVKNMFCKFIHFS